MGKKLTEVNFIRTCRIDIDDEWIEFKEPKLSDINEIQKEWSDKKKESLYEDLFYKSINKWSYDASNGKEVLDYIKENASVGVWAGIKKIWIDKAARPLEQKTE